MVKNAGFVPGDSCRYIQNKDGQLFYHADGAVEAVGEVCWRLDPKDPKVIESERKEAEEAAEEQRIADSIAKEEAEAEEEVKRQEELQKKNAVETEAAKEAAAAVKAAQDALLSAEEEEARICAKRLAAKYELSKVSLCSDEDLEIMETYALATHTRAITAQQELSVERQALIMLEATVVDLPPGVDRENQEAICVLKSEGLEHAKI